FRDTRPIDWDQPDRYDGILRLYHDLIRLRLNRDGFTRGLTGQHIAVHHVNDIDKVVAYRRWDEGGEGDVTLVVLNFSNVKYMNYRIGVEPGGVWRLRFNSDSRFYIGERGGEIVEDLHAEPGEYDGLRHSAELKLPAYTALIYSQDG
ncbi:MAG: alpha amylase C-terminal domain-containing protein, partial [Planctomycetota bacterium]